MQFIPMSVSELKQSVESAFPHPERAKFKRLKSTRLKTMVLLKEYSVKEILKTGLEVHLNEGLTEERWLPEQCVDSGALGCAGLASQVAFPGQECYGWEEAGQRMKRSEPQGPAHNQK